MRQVQGMVITNVPGGELGGVSVDVTLSASIFREGQRLRGKNREHYLLTFLLCYAPHLHASVQGAEQP